MSLSRGRFPACTIPMSRPTWRDKTFVQKFVFKFVCKFINKTQVAHNNSLYQCQAQGPEFAKRSQPILSPSHFWPSMTDFPLIKLAV